MMFWNEEKAIGGHWVRWVLEDSKGRAVAYLERTCESSFVAYEANNMQNKYRFIERLHSEAMVKVEEWVASSFRWVANPFDEKTEGKMNIEDTLKERGERYGEFADYATIADKIKEAMDWHDNPNLKPIHTEALSMIASKIARILCGDPDYKDNWHDIAGYAALVENELNYK